MIESDKIMINYPKTEMELKHKIRMNCYEMLEMAYEINSSTNVELKLDRLNLIFAKIKMIDFLLDLSREKGIISSKKYCKLGYRLDNITKYATGWRNNIENNKKKYEERKKAIEQKSNQLEKVSNSGNDSKDNNVNN